MTHHPASINSIEGRILCVRGVRVILDADLARIYGVPTRNLNQAVKRNAGRFPGDFLFKLTPEEATDALRSRSQFVILKRGQNVKHVPYAFTEHGAVMAANVVRSRRAVEGSVYVVRAFIRIRQVLATHNELSRKLEELDRRVGAHDGAIRELVTAIRSLAEPPPPARRRIGFRLDGQEP